MVKLLGLHWNTRTDKFSIALPSVNEEIKICKRFMLSVIARPFDPDGWIAPVFLKGRNIIKDVMREKYSWDKPVDKKYQQRWKDMVDQ